ncbi:hypothetical protein V1525DRAFT_80153 [Lipomyces kononenkoae]|uniref:Uncharacterized protein n=1 Tax=Lipomyces kononenkoae TaxID=34357 RepID=A0ACC3T595_LIPKO
MTINTTELFCRCQDRSLKHVSYKYNLTAGILYEYDNYTNVDGDCLLYGMTRRAWGSGVRKIVGPDVSCPQWRDVVQRVLRILQCDRPAYSTTFTATRVQQLLLTSQLSMLSLPQPLRHFRRHCSCIMPIYFRISAMLEDLLWLLRFSVRRTDARIFGHFTTWRFCISVVERYCSVRITLGHKIISFVLWRLCLCISAFSALAQLLNDVSRTE